MSARLKALPDSALGGGPARRDMPSPWMQVALQKASIDGAQSTLKAAETKALQDARHASSALEEAQALHQAAVALQAEQRQREAVLARREGDVRAAQISLQSATSELQVCRFCMQLGVQCVSERLITWYEAGQAGQG
jgi:hypothetical protein